MTEVKAGFLHKCEGNGKSWKKHWMILRTNGKLIYYEKKGGQEKGSVDLIKSGHIGLTKNIDSATERLPLGIDDATAFSIVTKERTYTLYAESPADCNEWIAKLLKVRNRSDGNKGYPAPTNPTQRVRSASQPARTPGTIAGFGPPQRLPYPPPATPQPQQAVDVPTNPTQPVQPASQPAQQVQMEQAPPLPAKAQYTRSLNTTTSYGPPHQLPYRGPPQATPQPQQTMYRGPSPLPPYGPPTQAYRPPLAPQGYQPPPNPGYYQQPYPGYYQPAPVYRQPMPPQPVYRAPLPQRQLQQQMSSTVVVAGGITIDINQQQGIGGQRSNVVVKR